MKISKSMYRSGVVCVLAGAMTSLASTSALAADEETTALEEIVVTGVARPVNRLESSVSTSSIDIGDIDSLAPRSTQELLRSIPGVRSESSGGEGNANVTIRGIPLATGGSKYVQYQEDGLPVLLFGDLNFANADNFVRADWSLRRIESIRGGSASTFASGAPGAIINFISNTGDEESGAVGVSYGLDYDLARVDFVNSGKLNDHWSYSLGGFYHSGEGLRHTGFNGEQGGQFKLTLNKQIEGGYFRIHIKHLDDSVPTYMPAPLRWSGNGSFDNPPGIDLAHDSIYSRYQTQISSSDAFGNRVERDVTKGINAKVDSFGFEFDKDLSGGWHVNDKFRTSKISGSFIAPFSDGGSGNTAAVQALSLCNGSTTAAGAALSNCATARVTYGTGPNAGQSYAGLVINNLMFDTTFKDEGNMVNDLKITKDIGEALSVTAGYFNMHQNVANDWNSWQFILESLQRDPVPLNVVTSGPDGVFGNTDDQRVTSNGLYWPGLLSFAWDLKYDITAPYLNVGGKLADFNWDASVRRDKLKVRGVNVAVCCGNVGGFDFDGSGTIEPFEARGRSIASSTNPSRANYDTSHTSFSLGGSYLLNSDMSVFARYSKGASFPADRLLQIGGALGADGSLSSTTTGYDEVKQIEAGFKWLVGRTSFYATLFNTETDETNAEVTSGLTFQRSYKASGAELEGNWRGDSGFGVTGNLTFIDAKIDQDKLNPALNGVKPRRQAPYIFTITPSYRASIWEVGLTAQGSGSYFLQDAPESTPNRVKQKAYVIFNAYGSVSFTEALSASLSVNNLSDEIVATEVEEGTATPGSYVRGRLLTGRTTNLALKYKF